jgi:hypothetical protein
MANGIQNYFPETTNDPNDPRGMLPSPFYTYTSGNLFAPRGYAQGTLVDLLSTRGETPVTDTTESITEDIIPDAVVDTVDKSDEQSNFGGRDINPGQYLDFEEIDQIELVDGLFGGKALSGGSPTGFTTQDLREFNALKEAGLKPKAKWDGSKWYVFAPELSGTIMGEPGTIGFMNSLETGGKYGHTFPTLFGALTGSYKPDEIFRNNLAKVLSERKIDDAEAFEDIPLMADKPTTIEQAKAVVLDKDATDKQVEAANKVLGVSAKQGGTVTAKQGGTVRAKNKKDKQNFETLKQKTKSKGFTGEYGI